MLTAVTQQSSGKTGGEFTREVPREQVHRVCSAWVPRLRVPEAVMAAQRCRPSGAAEREGGGATETDTDTDTETRALTAAQRDALERSLEALRRADNDSHVLAALLLITRVCPASQLDPPTLRHIFEAVGVALPARLLLTALRGSQGGAALPPRELLSLGTALLAALSTDPDMAAHPQLLATVPLLLRILAQGPEQQGRSQSPEPGPDEARRAGGSRDERAASSWLDEAAAADCFQVLSAVCALPRGPEQLLGRGAVPALCRAAQQDRTWYQQRALALLACLLSGPAGDKAWSKHSAELLPLLLRLAKDFCAASDRNRLDLGSQLVHFLPPVGVATDSEELRAAVGEVWAALRPTIQAKLTPRQAGPVLVLSACLLDLYGWEPVGPPKLCCLLVNRACVEVRMGLEEPPGHDLSADLQETLTGCYRIMEAAIEQACSAAITPASGSPGPSLSLAQTRQVLAVLQEAFAATIFYLQQVEPGRYGDPFVFATFRCLCSWLAEETSCLREEVTGLLPFLITFSRSHLRAEPGRRRPSGRTSPTSVTAEGGACGGSKTLRYLLPALCHLSAEPGPRKVLLGLDTPALLVDFLSLSWTSLRGRGGAARDPGMETASSALLNFTVTEPERVRKDACFRTLEALLSDALPVMVHKPALLVLSANYCTLGLMIGRLNPAGPISATQRRFLSAALHFLGGALESGAGPAAAPLSPVWEESWAEAAELWRLSLQALGGCVRAQPAICTLLRDEGWLTHTLGTLARRAAPPDRHTQAALEEALSAAAEHCALCREDITVAMTTGDTGTLSGMKNLKKLLEAK